MLDQFLFLISNGYLYLRHLTANTITQSTNSSHRSQNHAKLFSKQKTRLSIVHTEREIQLLKNTNTSYQNKRTITDRRGYMQRDEGSEIDCTTFGEKREITRQEHINRR